ncbi:Aminodeoxychorismate synthase, chloroplastic-like protein, partial [Drosera capensis]
MANVALSGDLVQEHLKRSVIVKKQSKEVSKEVDFVRTLLIDNYDSYTYNIYQELSVVNGGPPFVVRNDEWTWEEAYYYLYEARAFDNIVISPGPGSPALGYVHGGKIVLAPEPIHGHLRYNLKVECGATFNHHRSSSPDACFFFADNFLVIDHRCNDVYIMSLFEVDKALSSWLDDAEKRLLDLQVSSTKNAEDNPSMSALASPFEAGFVSEKSREQYLEDVEKCLEYIKNGQSYELCLTTQFRKRITDLAPIDLYMSLRDKNPAPYAAWLNFSKHNLSICCFSAEQFLDEILEAKAIKGTSPRGSSSHEDEQLKLILQYSEKDQAENLMIVDLLRNDLGLHTLVSTVRGERRADVSSVECVRAAFPGGSMTGAPKLRSMEMLDSLESCSRGIYSGSIWYFSIISTFDLNIVIRTVVMHDGEASIGAGGAIVALSIPEDECDEMILKTRAPVKAIVE